MSLSISNTVYPGLPLGDAPRGRVPAALPLRWPNMNPGEVKTYGIDVTNAVVAGDAVSSASAPVIVPASAGGLAATTPAIAGTVVSMNFSGGVAGTDYGVTVTIAMESGAVLVLNCGLYVSTPAFPPASPISCGSL